MEDLHIDELLLPRGRPCEYRRERRRLDGQYVCTLEDDFDFDDLLQAMTTPSTEEELKDDEAQPSGRRLTDFKQLEKFEQERVLDDKSSKRVRCIVDKSSDCARLSSARSMLYGWQSLSIATRT